MDVPTAVILAAAAGLALKCLADLADRHRNGERKRIERESSRNTEARPGLRVTGGDVSGDVPAA